MMRCKKIQKMLKNLAVIVFCVPFVCKGQDFFFDDFGRTLDAKARGNVSAPVKSPVSVDQGLEGVGDLQDDGQMQHDEDVTPDSDHHAEYEDSDYLMNLNQLDDDTPFDDASYDEHADMHSDAQVHADEDVAMHTDEKPDDSSVDHTLPVEEKPEEVQHNEQEGDAGCEGGACVFNEDESTGQAEGNKPVDNVSDDQAEKAAQEAQKAQEQKLKEEQAEKEQERAKKRQEIVEAIAHMRTMHDEIKQGIADLQTECETLKTKIQEDKEYVAHIVADLFNDAVSYQERKVMVQHVHMNITEHGLYQQIESAYQQLCNKAEVLTGQHDAIGETIRNAGFQADFEQELAQFDTGDKSALENVAAELETVKQLQEVLVSESAFAQASVFVAQPGFHYCVTDMAEMIKQLLAGSYKVPGSHQDDAVSVAQDTKIMLLKRYMPVWQSLMQALDTSLYSDDVHQQAVEGVMHYKALLSLVEDAQKQLDQAHAQAVAVVVPHGMEKLGTLLDMLSIDNAAENNIKQELEKCRDAYNQVAFLHEAGWQDGVRNHLQAYVSAHGVARDAEGATLTNIATQYRAYEQALKDLSESLGAVTQEGISEGAYQAVTAFSHELPGMLTALEEDGQRSIIFAERIAQMLHMTDLDQCMDASQFQTYYQDMVDDLQSLRAHLGIMVEISEVDLMHVMDVLDHASLHDGVVQLWQVVMYKAITYRLALLHTIEQVRSGAVSMNRLKAFFSDMHKKVRKIQGSRFRKHIISYYEPIALYRAHTPLIELLIVSLGGSVRHSEKIKTLYHAIGAVLERENFAEHMTFPHASYVQVERSRLLHDNGPLYDLLLAYDTCVDRYNACIDDHQQAGVTSDACKAQAGILMVRISALMIDMQDGLNRLQAVCTDEDDQAGNQLGQELQDAADQLQELYDQLHKML